MNLFFNEFGEEAFGFDSSDVAAVVAPNEDAAFDVEEEQSRGCPRHWIGSDRNQKGIGIGSALLRRGRNARVQGAMFEAKPWLGSSGFGYYCS